MILVVLLLISVISIIQSIIDIIFSIIDDIIEANWSDHVNENGVILMAKAMWQY